MPVTTTMPNNATEINENSKKTNGNNEETDLGSAASSANSSGDEEDDEPEEDPEIEFKTQRRTTRSATSSRGNKRGRPRKSEGTREQPSRNSPRIRRGSPAMKSASQNSKPKSQKQNGSKNRRKSSITCQLCSEVLDEDLSRHLSLVHFRTKLAKLLPSMPPYKCPKCASSQDSHDDLISHYGGQHKLNDRYLSEELKLNANSGLRRSSRTTTRSSSVDSNSRSESHNSDHANNGVITIDDSDSSEQNSDDNSDDDFEENGGEENDVDETKPPAAWLTPKPTSYNEFINQVKSLLVTKDGRSAHAVDDFRIKCICGKVIKCNLKYNWRFMIQKPTLRNGVPVQKGHWYLCSEVSTAGSKVEDWKLSKTELENSKAEALEALATSSPKGCDEVSSPKRTSRKRGSLVDSSLTYDESVTNKRSRNNNSDEDSEESESESDGGDETPREQRMILRKRVNDLLATRVPGEIFLQDGPCFQV